MKFKNSSQRKAVMAKLHGDKPQGWVNYSYYKDKDDIKVGSCPHKYFLHNQEKLRRAGYKLKKVVV